MNQIVMAEWRSDACAGSSTKADAVAALRAVLSCPEDRFDYGRAKLALDKIIDPSIDIGATMAELDDMAERARHLAGGARSIDARLTALRKLIYQSGAWNDHRPFDYDHSNFRGRDVRVKLLSHYLATRRGDCVSRPALFLILAEKLGIDVALSTAPLHVFVRYRDRRGRIVNLETTSGALPARDIWLRQIRPVSDRALETGLYLRTLSRREGVAVMANAVVQYLRDRHRYEEALTAADAILLHNPRDALALANKAFLNFRLLQVEFLDRYESPFLIPLQLRPRHLMLIERHQGALAAAEALGWEHCV